MSFDSFKSAAVLAVILFAGANVSRAAPGDIYNLGTLGGPNSFAFGINSAGQLTGSSATGTAAAPHAFRYTGIPGSGGAMIDLGMVGRNSGGEAINNSGQVAGTSYFSDFDQHAFLYTGTPGSGGIMHDLGTLAEGDFGFNDSFGTGVNASGQVTGYSRVGNPPFHAFLYTGTPGVDGVMHDLGTLGGSDSRGYAINDAGQVAGYSQLTANLTYHAFRYTGTPGSGGIMHDLGTLGGTDSSGAGINASGQVVGSSQTTEDTATHAFRYTGTPGGGGLMADLGTLGGTNSYATAINDLGWVVGHSDIAGDGTSHPFLYIGTPGAGGHMIDFDAWLDANNAAAGANWTLNFATDVTGSGLVAGYGIYNDGAGGLSDGTRAFLLDASAAVPEPMSLSLLAVAALARRRSRSARRRNTEFTDEVRVI
jgi:probable HAF family extracellular repeat protein